MKMDHEGRYVVFISYKNPNARRDDLKLFLTKLGITWSDEPDVNQPLIERLVIDRSSMTRDEALLLGAIYGCEVWI
jgi:hypothetical protein